MDVPTYEIKSICMLVQWVFSLLTLRGIMISIRNLKLSVDLIIFLIQLFFFIKIFFFLNNKCIYWTTFHTPQRNHSPLLMKYNKNSVKKREVIPKQRACDIHKAIMPAITNLLTLIHLYRKLYTICIYIIYYINIYVNSAA